MSALEAPKDGYTWTAGAAQDLGRLRNAGVAQDPHYRLEPVPANVANVEVLSVNANAPYKTAKELLDAMAAQPGKISVATAGIHRPAIPPWKRSSTPPASNIARSPMTAAIRRWSPPSPGRPRSPPNRRSNRPT